MMTTRRQVMAGSAGLVAAAATAGLAAEPRRKPLVFGHRGASALRPEHTLASYAKAVADGADFIEPDLVISKDGALVIRHENNIAGTTDVAKHPEFADRKTEKIVDGERQVGWFVEDFTLAELKTLRAVERLPQLRPANAALDGRFDLVTWPEMVDFAAAESLARGRPIGLVPELKHSTYFQSIGLPLEDRFLATLGQHDYLSRCALVIQSFEIANLKYMRGKLGRRANLQLMQLTSSEAAAEHPADVVKAGGTLTYGAMMAPAGLADIAAYADILAPDTRAIIPLDAQKRLGRPTPVVADAHKAGLLVLPYTFRPENYFLAADFRDGAGDAARNEAGSVAEMKRYLAAGIDGFFTDDPGLGRRAVDGA
ncbi:glycerophosphodiester phosphodiesterase [Sphingomonas nostoxanthinifaciens]|uniref:glycerophosphodiester phosphodiesterase n=1 Tax=Sphingomonas nostoxanthinifaciens TaxID=2872652 RepID=UPI001CC21DF6|nr:glycerophosphodiester phosphodiesterase [Sphingomonas nostoxanthinifaciens]UAK26645.1 glycerophosphodiester phosphodiesterase [Sphingomonas nostoxanthinifaciens]